MAQQVLDFSFVQIPRQVTYIKKNYLDEVDKILSQKKLIPFVYQKRTQSRVLFNYISIVFFLLRLHE